MAQIIPPWQTVDTSPTNNQRIFACIGKRDLSDSYHYIVAIYERDGDSGRLYYPSYGGGPPTYINLEHLLAWQPLDIIGPGIIT